MRVALVHDWLNGMRGGENVLEAIASIFPRSKICTLFCESGKISPELRKHEIATSFIQKLPGWRTHYRYYLPLFPRAIEKFDFGETDLVISSSHCVAKGAVTGRENLHICYCHSPMRYVWDRFDDYFPKDKINPAGYIAVKYLTNRLRRWDLRTSGRVDLYLANSSFVKRRINDYYDRPARVIHPPVDTDYFTPGGKNDGEYYLMAGALVPYKRVDLAIEAFRNFPDELVVTGDGPDFMRLVNNAPSNVRFTGWIDRETLREYYRGCKALLFPGVEDFGIVPVEAQACGKPVIAFGEGGIFDTVIGPYADQADNYDGFKSGIFFKSRTSRAIRDAIRKFESSAFDFASIREHALKFSKARFFREFNAFLEESVGIFRNSGKEMIERRLMK